MLFILAFSDFVLEYFALIIFFIVFIFFIILHWRKLASIQIATVFVKVQNGSRMQSYLNWLTWLWK